MPATQDHHAAPPSPAGSSTSDSSSSNSVSTGPPQTPVSASLPLAMPTFMNFTGEDSISGIATLNAPGGVKRTSKTTRRINTAERRATHNAVERQRRETLNSRFLDLAGLLSNLSQIRRPSKSAIVNSSIAHLNASRRHRILAAQQLRIMKVETDALRHEVNEWRARAGVAGVDEPMRSDAFGIVIRGELEFEAGDMVDADDGEEEGDSAGSNAGVYGGQHYAAEPSSYEEADEYAMLQHQQQQQRAEMLAAQMHGPFAHTRLHPQASPYLQSHGVHPAHRQASAHYYTSPTIVHPGLAAFENPAMDYDPRTIHPELEAKWAYEKHQQMLHAHAQQQRQAAW